MISLKCINDAKNGLGVFLLYSISRFIIKRKGYFPKYIKYSRFLGTASLVGYFMYISNNYTKSHQNMGLMEYKSKRYNFDKHTKIMKDIMKSKHELIQTKSKYEESQVSIKKILSEQNQK